MYAIAWFIHGIWSAAMIRSALLFVFKLPVVLKLTAVGAIIFSTASITNLPINDFWFDYALFVVCSAIVTGMPEPDTNLPFVRFMYSWLYRSLHLMVASATSYFMHQNKWGEINNGPPDGPDPNKPGPTNAKRPVPQATIVIQGAGEVADAKQ